MQGDGAQKVKAPPSKLHRQDCYMVVHLVHIIYFESSLDLAPVTESSERGTKDSWHAIDQCVFV